MKNSVLWFCRIFVGGLFIFSGLVKANDPVGFGIKLEEYYDVFADRWSWTSFLFQADWVLDTINLQAVFLTTLEVALGIALLLGIWKNITAWLLLLLIVFFTWLTGYSAITGSVTDCGCFGDFIPLTPWESFYKDLVLIFLIIIIFILRKNIKPILKPVPSFLIFVLVTGFAWWINSHVLKHDVFFDWRPYAVGNNIPELMVIPPDAEKDVVEMNYNYSNVKTAEKIKLKFLNTELSDKSKMAELTKYSTDKENWKLDTSYTKLKKKGFRPKIIDFAVSDENDNYITDQILNNPDFSIMVVSAHFDKTSEEGWEKINTLQQSAEKEGLFTFALVAESRDAIEMFRHERQMAFPFYTGDGKVCLTIGRTNPNIVLLQNGTVIDKWSWRDLPTFDEIKAAHFKDRAAVELKPVSDEMFMVGENVVPKIINSKEPYNEFFLQDSIGEDVTAITLSDTSIINMVIINELAQDKLTGDIWNLILTEMKKMDSTGQKYFVVSSGSPDILVLMKKASRLNYNYFVCDKDVLHKIMKENTGIVTLEKGIVRKKVVEGALL